MSGHKLVVTAEGPAGMGGSVELDGQDISDAVRGLSIELAAGHVPQVRLDVLVLDLSCDADGTAARIPDETRELLVKLGWTPPEDA